MKRKAPLRVTRTAARPHVGSERLVGDAADGAGSSGLYPELRRSILHVLTERKRLDKVIEQTLQRHRRLWSDTERTHFIEMMLEIVREWRWRWHLASLPDAEYFNGITDERVLRVLRAAPGAPRAKQTPAIEASFPDWLWTRASAEIRANWPRLVRSLAIPAPLFLRSNALRSDARQVAASLAAAGIETLPGPAGSLKVVGRRDVFRTPAFHSGDFEVQDAGSQMIAPMLEAEPGMRVLDACAGAGGKSLHLAALMKNKGRIIATDIHDWKLSELRRRAARAGVDNLETRLIEDARTTRRLVAKMDRVLLDVPCSGLGVLRRHPDRKWHLQPEELERLMGLQSTLLEQFSPLVKPGGKLLYATCSILPSENERQVAAFLAVNTNWKLETERTLWPEETGGDAFYAARMIRAE